MRVALDVSAVPARPAGAVNVYFKSRYAFSGAAGWWSYPLCLPQTLRHCDSVASADFPDGDEAFDFVLVAALNGRIVTSGYSYRNGDRIEATLMLPASSLKRGHNRVRLLLAPAGEPLTQLASTP